MIIDNPKSGLLQSLNQYDVFVCYYEATGAEHAENIKKTLEGKGYSVYVAHKRRIINEGNWSDLHDNIIRQCKIFIFINTLDALERPEVIRETTIAFPDSDTSIRSYWILRDESYEAPYNSPNFQQRTGIDLSKQNQTPFRHLSELNSIIIRKCLDHRQRPKEQLDKEVKPSSPERIY